MGSHVFTSYPAALKFFGSNVLGTLTGAGDSVGFALTLAVRDLVGEGPLDDVVRVGVGAADSVAPEHPMATNVRPLAITSHADARVASMRTC
jgi:hypothetical protein